MTVPFILDIVALIDISTLETSEFRVGIIGVRMKICLFDTDAKDEANVARSPSTSPSQLGKLPRLKDFRWKTGLEAVAEAALTQPHCCAEVRVTAASLLFFIFVSKLCLTFEV